MFQFNIQTDIDIGRKLIKLLIQQNKSNPQLLDCTNQSIFYFRASGTVIVIIKFFQIYYYYYSKLSIMFLNVTFFQKTVYLSFCVIY